MAKHPKRSASATVGDRSIQDTTLSYDAVQRRLDDLAGVCAELTAKSSASAPWVQDALQLARELKGAPLPARDELIEEIVLLLAYHSTVDPRNLGAP